MTKEEKLKKKAEAKRAEKIHLEMVEQQILSRKSAKKAPENICISFQHINKIYPNHKQAVFDFNLDIKEKEFVVFVGPSGCGKSTTLRMLAGLEEITYGDLYIDGKYANDMIPKERDVAMVFQNYALYPNMSVYDNMAFSLQARHYDKNEIDKRVREAAKILEIEEYLDTKPANLSGGQRQRVALGRAIVRNAKVFLMDEPLSNLDAKLRVQMRSEIVKLHNTVGATTVYVTHDQTEAMTMATRIVVMNKGRVQQIGTPKEIYNSPENIFVARFIGNPAMNILDCSIEDGSIVLPNGMKIPLTKEQSTCMRDFYDRTVSDIRLKIGAASKDVEDRKYEITHPAYVKDVLAFEKEKNRREKKISTLSKKLKKLKTGQSEKEQIEALSKELQSAQTELAVFIEQEEKRIQSADYKEDLPDNIETVFANDIYLGMYKYDLEKLQKELEYYVNSASNKKYNLKFGIRPEEIYEKDAFSGKSDLSPCFTASVTVAELIGHEYFVHFNMGEKDVIAKIKTDRELLPGDKINLRFDLRYMHLFDGKSEKRIF